MTLGDLIQIDGKPFVVERVNGSTPWFVESYTVKAHRSTILGKTKAGVWRYGKTGKVVTVEGPIADVRMERITARMGE